VWILTLAGTGALLCTAVAARSYWAERSFYVAHTSTPMPQPSVAGIAGLTEAVFSSDNGDTLYGWYAPNRNTASIVLLHGSSSDRRSVLVEARALARAGFGVLLFDWPGHGESHGSIQMGAAERSALKAALDWLARRPEVHAGRIGALGVSMGAYTLAQVAAGDVRVSAAILVSAPHDLRAQTLHVYRRWGPLSQQPALLAQKAHGIGIDDRNARDSIGGFAPRPLLVIAGAEDPVIPPESPLILAKATGASARVWVVPGAGHVDFADVAPIAYPRRVVDFFRASLLGSA
jgi:uncharacterized protein